MYHDIEFSATSMNGSFETNSTQEQSNGFSSPYYSKVWFNQHMYSLGYRFQPTYKHLFVALGILPSLNIVDYSTYVQTYSKQGVDLGSPPYVGTITTTNESNQSGRLSYFNLNLKFGLGGYFQLKKLVFKPGVYCTVNPNSGVQIYNASLAILYDTKNDNTKEPPCHNW